MKKILGLVMAGLLAVNAANAGECKLVRLTCYAPTYEGCVTKAGWFSTEVTPWLEWIRQKVGSYKYEIIEISEYKGDTGKLATPRTSFWIKICE